jgi:hypothetical protein
MIFIGRDPHGGSVPHVHHRGARDQVAMLCWHSPSSNAMVANAMVANSMVARDAGLVQQAVDVVRGAGTSRREENGR